MADLHDLAKSLSHTLKAHIDRRLEEFRASFRVPADGKDGASGPVGERGAPGVAGEAGKDGVQGERGEKGDAGRDGKDGAPGERGEKGIDGRDGKDGAPGERGEKGIDGRDFDPAALDAAVRAEVGKQFSDVYERVLRAIPTPKDGASVTIEDVTPLLEGAVAKWGLEFERRAGDMLQRALDRIPAGVDGKDGADGVGVDDFELESLDGGRTIAVSIAASSGLIIRKEITTAIPVDRGPYAIGRAYEPGDGVTYGGSFWIAQAATETSPGDSKGGMPWRLAVKHGRDAK